MQCSSAPRLAARVRAARGLRGPNLGSPQVIIIPIYWNKRAEEKAAVLAAAERAAAVLRRGGLSADMDASDERMPGAKFKHWRAALRSPCNGR